MAKFVVNGGARLSGKCRISGSKNASLPVIFASLIARGTSEIDNLPDIGDVRVALEIIKRYGASISKKGNTTYINTEKLRYTEPDAELVCKIRASTYLLGASAVRFGRARLSPFGGCAFSPRPIDMHLDALLSHGAVLSDNGDITVKRLVPSVISFKKRSVGASVNALILAAGASGESVIEGCALEPHILTLIEFLRSMGADISLEGDTARVRGGELHGGKVRIGPDMIEAGSYLALSLLTGGGITVIGAEESELSSFLEPLLESGAEISRDVGIRLCSRPRKPVRIVTGPYPEFPTDLQPIIAPVLALSGGSIRDTVWEGRFGYLSELSRLGISSRIVRGVAEIFPSELKSGNATAPDLRGGMALLMSALSAEGQSVIDGAEVILRGYDDPVGKLGQLGAEIEYVDN